MTKDTLVKKLTNLATISIIDNLITISTGCWVSLPIENTKSDLKFIDGSEVNIETLTEMLKVEIG